VGDREDPDLAGHLKVHDMVRKSWDRAASNSQFHWYPRHEGASLRHRDHSIDSGVNGIEELDA
jgi:hypothetical protein